MKQSVKKSRKPAAKARTTAVKHKKAAPKGIRHHAKRAYHATPKFVHGMIVGGVVGLLVVGFLGAFSVNPNSTSADILGTSCAVKRVGTNDAGTANSRFTLNNDGTVSAKFEVSGFNCHEAVTLDTWQAPNSTDGKPYSAQKLFSRTTGVYGVGVHTITTKMPDCFYQIDLLVGKVTATTVPYTSATPLRGNLHGGAQSCTPITPPVTPPTTPVVETAATSLPNTGPGAILIVLGLAILGGYVFHMTHRHRQHKKAAHHAAHHRKPAHHSVR